MPCKTVGIGSIQIRMHDGVIRTLTEVHHVLESKKNLISVRVLDSKGFKCSVEGGVMEIRKGPSMVMRGIKKGNLYILQGPTILGSSSVSLLFSCLKTWAKANKFVAYAPWAHE